MTYRERTLDAFVGVAPPDAASSLVRSLLIGKTPALRVCTPLSVELSKECIEFQENLSFPLEVRKMSKSEVQDRVKKALDMVELGDFGTRFIMI